jgi:hypothetical protein
MSLTPQRIDIISTYNNLCGAFNIRHGDRGAIARMAEEMGVDRKKLTGNLSRARRGEHVPQLLYDVILTATQRGFDINKIVTGARRPDPNPDSDLRERVRDLEAEIRVLERRLSQSQDDRDMRMANQIVDKLEARRNLRRHVKSNPGVDARGRK